MTRLATIDSRPPLRRPGATPLLALLLFGLPTGCTPAGNERGGAAPAREAATAETAAAAPAETAAAAPAETAAAAPAETAATAKDASDPVTPPTQALAPAGWSRLELSTVVPGMTGTIDLPPGVTAAAGGGQMVDVDGLEADPRNVHIGPEIGGLRLNTLIDIPPRFASAAAMARFHGQFELVETHEFGPDHWAVVQRWRAGECMIHGWSAAANLSCDLFQAPCDQIAPWVQICGTLRPGPTPNRSPTTTTSAFPALEPGAATVAMAVARAIARNDATMLIGALGPKGLKIGRKAYTAGSLEAALAGRSVVQVVAPGFFNETEGETTAGLFNWNGTSTKGEAKVWFTSGYGEQPFFTLRKLVDDWYLVGFAVHDLGEP